MKNSSFLKFTYYRGRVALHAILKALGIGVGDEVALQAFTCLAVPEAVMAVGARPIYVDIESAGFNMDPNDLKNKISPETKAIVVQHTYGIPVKINEICQISAETGLPVIEDCCHTFASTYEGKVVGSFGVASFYSFEWGKPIVIGIGGSAIVNDNDLRTKMKKLYANYRFPKFINQVRIQFQYYGFICLNRPSFYWQVRSLFHWLSSIGMAEGNYNPVGEGNVAEDFTIKMSIQLQERLAQKLKKLDILTQHSRWVAGEYKSRINSIGMFHPVLPEKSDVVFSRYPLLVANKNELLLQARKARVELSDWYYTPVHPVVREDWKHIRYVAGSCPNAEKRCTQVVTLPTYSGVGLRDIERAVDLLNTVMV